MEGIDNRILDVIGRECCIPCPTTSFRTSRFFAPSAGRTPISCVRQMTTQAISILMTLCKTAYEETF